MSVSTLKWESLIIDLGISGVGEGDPANTGAIIGMNGSLGWVDNSLDFILKLLPSHLWGKSTNMDALQGVC